MNPEAPRTGPLAVLPSVLQVATVGGVLLAGALLALVLPRGKTDDVAPGDRLLKTDC